MATIDINNVPYQPPLCDVCWLEMTLVDESATGMAWLCPQCEGLAELALSTMATDLIRFAPAPGVMVGIAGVGDVLDGRD